jgi:hypothetical protein
MSLPGPGSRDAGSSRGIGHGIAPAATTPDAGVAGPAGQSETGDLPAEERLRRLFQHVG